MAFNKYYQDELSFLREMGKEFSQAYPAAAQFLADRGSDPDVERLLEGFAFLSGRIRQKLDDEFPELIHAMMNLLWPHYLRPIPSVSMIEFNPIPGAVKGRQRITRGVELASVPVEGTPCRFRTCFDVDLFPMQIQDVNLKELSSGSHALNIRMLLNPGIKFSDLELKSLRLHLFGESAYTLYLWLCRYVTEIRIRSFTDKNLGSEVLIPRSSIRPVGFSKEEALLPYPKTSFDGYRLLQEYFTFPEKFLFIDIENLGLLSRLGEGSGFEIQIILSKPPPASLRVTQENVRLYCSPVVNLFEMESDPVRVEHDRVEYRVRPSSSKPLNHEIYSINHASGWVRGTAQQQVYEPFYSFKRGLGTSSRRETYYQTHLRNAVIGEGTDTYVSFVNTDQSVVMPPTETIVFELTVTNRNLPSKLRVGDIHVSTETSPEFATFRNILKLSSTVHPSVGGDHYWRLISHLSLNYISLMDVEALRGILGLYNLQSMYDQQAARANERRLNGITRLQSRGESMLLRGAPVRGTATRIDMKEDHFTSEGDMFLFASILNEFFSLYASINSFHQMTVMGQQQGEVYEWEANTGQQVIL